MRRQRATSTARAFAEDPCPRASPQIHVPQDLGTGPYLDSTFAGDPVKLRSHWSGCGPWSSDRCFSKRGEETQRTRHVTTWPESGAERSQARGRHQLPRAGEGREDHPRAFRSACPPVRLPSPWCSGTALSCSVSVVPVVLGQALGHCPVLFRVSGPHSPVALKPSFTVSELRTCPSRPPCPCKEPGSSSAAGGGPKACSR